MCGVDFVLHSRFTPSLDVRGTTGVVLYWPRRVFIVGFTIQIPRADDFKQLYYVQLGEPKYVIRRIAHVGLY